MFRSSVLYFRSLVQPVSVYQGRPRRCVSCGYPKFSKAFMRPRLDACMVTTWRARAGRAAACRLLQPAVALRTFMWLRPDSCRGFYVAIGDHGYLRPAKRPQLHARRGRFADGNAQKCPHFCGHSCGFYALYFAVNFASISRSSSSALCAEYLLSICLVSAAFSG